MREAAIELWQAGDVQIADSPPWLTASFIFGLVSLLPNVANLISDGTICDAKRPYISRALGMERNGDRHDPARTSTG